MAEIFEAIDSPQTDLPDSGRGGSATLRYHIIGEPDRQAALQLLQATAPLVYDTGDGALLRQSVSIEALSQDTWEGRAEYGGPESSKSEQPPQPSQWKFSFRTTGGRHRITQSRFVVSSLKFGGGSAPSFYNAIGWDGRQVQGVEIPVPTLQITVTAYYAPGFVTSSVMKLFAAATGRMNSDPFLGFEPGEVLYVGAEGDGEIPRIGGGQPSAVSITHHFDCSANRLVSITGLGTLNVLGWDYLDIVFEEFQDDLHKSIFPRPKYAYVHRVFDQLAFTSFFGFG